MLYWKKREDGAWGLEESSPSALISGKKISHGCVTHASRTTSSLPDFPALSSLAVLSFAFLFLSEYDEP